MHYPSPTHQLSIHVANDNPSARAMHDGRKRKVLEPYSVEHSKRAKISRPANPSNPPSSLSNSVAQPNAETSAHTASFRHLFSFANDDKGENRPLQLGGHAAVTNQPFSLLDTAPRGDADSTVKTKGRAPGVAAVFTKKAEQVVRGHRQMLSSAGAVERRDNLVELEDVRPASSSWPITQGGSLAKLQPRLNRTPGSATQGQNATLYDEFDVSSDTVLAMARDFCRKRDIDDLEDEWCKDGGIRDQMRRDFKLKLQNVVRDRKLGGAANRT